MQVTIDIEDLRAFLAQASDEEEEFSLSDRHAFYWCLRSLFASCAPRIGTKMIAALDNVIYELDTPRRLEAERVLAEWQAQQEREQEAIRAKRKELEALVGANAKVKSHATWATPVTTDYKSPTTQKENQ